MEESFWGVERAPRRRPPSLSKLLGPEGEGHGGPQGRKVRDDKRPFPSARPGTPRREPPACAHSPLREGADGEGGDRQGPTSRPPPFPPPSGVAAAFTLSRPQLWDEGPSTGVGSAPPVRRKLPRVDEDPGDTSETRQSRSSEQ